MTLSGKPLGAELKKILQVAENHVPSMSEKYEDANTTLSFVVVGEHNFASGDFAVGGLCGAWMDAKNNLQAIFGATLENLNDTSSALFQVINDYISDDDQAAEGLKAEIEDHNGDYPGSKLELPENGSTYEYPGIVHKPIMPKE